MIHFEYSYFDSSIIDYFLTFLDLPAVLGFDFTSRSSARSDGLLYSSYLSSDSVFKSMSLSSLKSIFWFNWSKASFIWLSSFDLLTSNYYISICLSSSRSLHRKISSQSKVYCIILSLYTPKSTLSLYTSWYWLKSKLGSFSQFCSYSTVDWL